MPLILSEGRAVSYSLKREKMSFFCLCFIVVMECTYYVIYNFLSQMNIFFFEFFCFPTQEPNLLLLLKHLVSVKTRKFGIISFDF